MLLSSVGTTTGSSQAAGGFSHFDLLAIRHARIIHFSHVACLFIMPAHKIGACGSLELESFQQHSCPHRHRHEPLAESHVRALLVYWHLPLAPLLCRSPRIRVRSWKTPIVCWHVIPPQVFCRCLRVLRWKALLASLRPRQLPLARLLPRTTCHQSMMSRTVHAGTTCLG